MKAAIAAFFPLDRHLRLTETAFSPQLTRQMGWLAGMLPYGQAEEVFARIGNRHIGATSIWEQVRRYGPRLKAAVDERQTHVAPERVVLPGYDLDIRKGVSLDGGMVHIRGEGWKEMKVGTVFDVE